MNKKSVLISILIIFSVFLFFNLIFASSNFSLRSFMALLFFPVEVYLFFKLYKSKKARKILFLVFLTTILLLLIPVLFNYKSTAISHLYILCLIFAHLIGFIIVKCSNKCLVVVSLFLLSFNIFVSYVVYPKYINYINFGNISGGKSYTFPKIYFTEDKEYKDTIDILNNDSIYYVLDFFNTRCKHCFSEMPKYQGIKTKYSSDIVKFYFVNAQFKNELLYMLDTVKIKYDIPLIYIGENDLIKLSMDKFPRLLIIKNKMIVYDNNLNGLESFFKKNKIFKNIK